MDRTGIVDIMKQASVDVMTEEMNKFYKQYSPIYPKLCTVKPLSDMNNGSYHYMTSISGFSELLERAENAPITFQDPTAGYPIYVKKRSFDLGVELTLEVEEDIKAPALRNMMQNYIKGKAFPQAVARTKEKLVTGLFNDGGLTAGSSKFDNSIPGIVTPSYGSFVYDTKAFFNTSGTNRSAKAHSTTYYNHIGALPLTYDNFLIADILLCSTNAKDEKGEPYDNTQDNFLMHPTALRGTTFKLLNSELNPSNNNNDANQVKGNYTPLVNPYLTSSTAWFVGNKSGIVMFDSNAVEFEFWRIPETRKYRGSAHLSLGIAVTNWRAWVGGYVAQS